MKDIVELLQDSREDYLCYHYKHFVHNLNLKPQGDFNKP